VFKEFREFISRGNVVDLAVAVVVGTAFTQVVNALVEGLITPLIALFGERDYTDLAFTVRDSTFRYGLVITATLSFLMIAAAVFFFVVKPLNMLEARKRRGEVATEELSDEAVLLAEIRDLLRNGSQRPPDRTAL
jgi:large conductance mechanosensitive channel